MSDPRFKALEDDIREILAKHKAVSATLLIQLDDTKEVLICGNMCPVCSLETMFEFVWEENLEHTDSSSRKVH